jgi:CubicO group peptidase (beta-lactamase class C family)
MKAVLSRFGLILLLVALPAALVAATADEAPPVQPKSVAGAVKSFVDDGTLAGAVVLVANKDKVLTVEAVGWADIAAKMMMPIDALFWIASMSKPITAAALMMLVDEGKVNLDDPVEKYIPEFKNVRVPAGKPEKGKEVKLRKPSHSMTVREVLSHTSGLPFGCRRRNRRSTCCRSRTRCSATPRTRCCTIRAQAISIPTPASTRRGASSKSPAACRMRIFSIGVCSYRSA